MKYIFYILGIIILFVFPINVKGQVKKLRNKKASIRTIAKSDDCGLIQVLIILDKNCNGVFDTGDEVGRNINVSLMQNSAAVSNTNSNENGFVFFPYLSPGSYSSSINIPQGWEIGSSQSNTYITEDGVGSLEYFLCESCNCFDTSGPPEQSLTIPNNVMPGVGLSFRITDPDFSPFQIGAYNANEYLLVIFDRTGGEVHRSTRKDCNGLKNGEIVWDGKDKNGKHLQQDNYNGYLVLQNCDYYCKNDDTSSNFWNGLLDRCPKNVRYFNIILVH